MNDNEICFNLKCFLSFLKQFEPIAEKYRVGKLLEMKGEVSQEVREGILKHLISLEEYDALYRPQTSSTNEYSQIWEDLCQIYGDREPIQDYLKVYKYSKEKLIDRFLGIPGLDKLYMSRYFHFEWRMHLNLDFNQHRQSYYRDHFIHQAKNAYMMYQTLTHMGFFETILSVLQESATPAVRYFKRSIAQARQETIKNNTLNELMKEQFILIQGKEYCPGPQCDGYLQDNWDEYLHYIDACHTERLLLFVTILAGLFHDLGYPLAFSMDSMEDMGDFLPISHYFVQENESFTRINAELVNSMLFTLVPSRELEKRFLQRDHGTLSALAFLLYFYENGSIFSLNVLDRAAIELAAITIYDHTLVYNFQEKTIKKLERLGISPKVGPVLDKIISARDNHYYRPSAFITPLSFLFRLCDDLQEWDRIYFFLSTSHNLRMCRRCGMPIIRTPIWRSEERIRAAEKNRTICGCSIGFANDTLQVYRSLDSVTAISFRTPTEYTASDIDYRKLFHIKICEQVKVNKIFKEYSKPGDIPLGFVVDVQYDPFKLLQMCQIDPQFAPHRVKELRKTRERLTDQWGMPKLAVNAFITNNPLLIKLRIIEDFLVFAAVHAFENEQLLTDGCFCWSKEFSIQICSVLNTVVELSQSKSGDSSKWNRVEKKLNNVFHQLIVAFSKDKTGSIQRRLKKRFEFYIQLMILGWRLRAGQLKLLDYITYKEKKDSRASKYKVWEKVAVFADNYAVCKLNTGVQGQVCGDALGELMDDCLYQYAACGVSPRRIAEKTSGKESVQVEYAKSFDYTAFIRDGKQYPKGYFEQFKPQENDESAQERMNEIVSRYTSPKTYRPDIDPASGIEPIDFFADLLFFKMLSNSTVSDGNRQGGCRNNMDLLD